MLVQVLTDFSWLLTFLVGLTTWILVKHLLDIRSLPPGPFPLPFIGNLLNFRGTKAADVFKRYRQKYGDIYTVWFGTQKTVLISGYPLIREALIERRLEFAGKPQSLLSDLFTRGTHGITSTDCSPQWEILRKMTHSALRKYAVSDKLPPLIDEIVAGEVGQMLSAKKPFDLTPHVFMIVFNVVMSSFICETFILDNASCRTFFKAQKDIQKFTGNGFPPNLSPILRPFYLHHEWQLRRALDDIFSFVTSKLKEHQATYKSGVIRDLMDSLLNAREESIAEKKETAAFLKDENLVIAMFDVFGAATATTEITLRWIFLFLATYPEIEKKVVAELKQQIGDNIPLQEDRKRCPYTCAVIAETMRIRSLIPLGLPRKATRDTNIGGFDIPKNTQVFIHVETAHMDNEKWENSEVFCPERFLKNGEFTTEKTSHFLPFGLGRRSCIGEKLATADIFMVVAGILKRCHLAMKVPPEDLDSVDFAVFYIPKEHKVIAEPRC